MKKLVVIKKISELISMGRKRKNVEMARVTVTIPKEIKDELQKAGVNLTQLFLDAAIKMLEKKE